MKEIEEVDWLLRSIGLKMGFFTMVGKVTLCICACVLFPTVRVFDRVYVCGKVDMSL